MAKTWKVWLVGLAVATPALARDPAHDPSFQAWTPYGIGACTEMTQDKHDAIALWLRGFFASENITDLGHKGDGDLTRMTDPATFTEGLYYYCAKHPDDSFLNAVIVLRNHLIENRHNPNNKRKWVE